jgi:hypothetical protein
MEIRNLFRMIGFSAVFACFFYGPHPACFADTGEDYSTAYVEEFTGDCSILRHNKKVKEEISELYTPLYEGDTVLTGPGCTAELVFDDSTMVNLDENSEMSITGLKRKGDFETSLKLAAGRAIAIVNKLFEGEKFTVSTKMAMAAVKGTEFAVEAGDEHKVGVFDGSVEVSGLDDHGAVVKRMVLEKDNETTIDRKGRFPGQARHLGQAFRKHMTHVRSLRQKIQMIRSLKQQGKLTAYKHDHWKKHKAKREQMREKMKRMLHRP